MPLNDFDHIVATYKGSSGEGRPTTYFHELYGLQEHIKEIALLSHLQVDQDCRCPMLQSGAMGL